MSRLMKKYGTCLIPKGTLLFRSNTAIHPNQLFFALYIKVAAEYNNGDSQVQVWQAISDIEVLFMVSEISDSRAWVNSSIVDIYKSYFPDTADHSFFSEDVKHFDKNRLNRLIPKMKEENIAGWFTSIKDKIDCEVCLFDNSKVNLLETTDDIKKYTCYNYLKQLQLFPSPLFDQNCKKYIEDPESFPIHLRYYNYITRNELPANVTSEEAEYEYFNLRLKLKV